MSVPERNRQGANDCVPITGMIVLGSYHFRCHHLQEFREVDGAGPIFIDVRNHLFDFLLLGLEPKGTHSYFQLLGIDSTCQTKTRVKSNGAVPTPKSA